MSLGATTVHHLTFGRLDAGGTRLRLRALHVMGHGSARIARALGVREETIQRLVRGDARTISPPLRDAIADLYDAWWDKRAPERTRAERAATARARRRASAGNWCAGAALNDDQLDVPGYRPRTGYRHRHRSRHPPARPPLPEERRMTGNRTGVPLITDILDVLDRHGYTRSDNADTARAILLISDLAHIYQGSLDRPFGPCINEIPPSRTELAPPQPASQDAVVLSANQVSTIAAALDEASLNKRDRVATCADCADQSCGTCQWRLQAAQTYDSLAVQLVEKARPPGP
jgi:hypothetical protein